MVPITLPVLMIILSVVACGKSEDAGPTPFPPAASTVGEIEDTSAAGIAAFLREGTYKGWATESAVHDSTGPHGKVRSFYNSKLAQSLADQNPVHPVGSISVKELYETDGATLNGYALEAKTIDETGGNAWLWFEGFSPKFNEYYGQGLSTCTDCHRDGIDFIKSAP